MRRLRNYQITGISIVLSLVLFFTADLVRADPNTVEISGMLLYNGAPMSDITDSEPAFFCKDIEAGQKSIPITTTYDNTTGSFSISDLPPHELALFFIFHIQGTRSTLPGNYRRQIVVDVGELTEWERSHFDVDMLYIIHMTSPWDNNNIDFSTYPYDPYPSHCNTLDFIWDPVPGATEHTFIIDRWRDPDHPDGYGFVASVVYTALDDNFYSVELDDSECHEHYQSLILAYNSVGEKIAKYMTTYENGYGADYRFKVRTYPIGNLAIAWGPDPRERAKDVLRDVVLSWGSGDYVQDANAHEVYFGTDFDDVNDANDPSILPGRGRQDANSYDPGGLDLGKTYYWRIDEVNDANLDSPWKGNVWNFTVANFLIIDDMESYTAEELNRIYDTWHDWSKYQPVGGEYPTAAQLTLETEDANVHGGKQSMKFEYNNSDDGGWLFYRDISEIDANTIGPLMHLEIGQDWTIVDMKVLTLHFIGCADNDATEQMYVALEDSVGRTAVVPYGYYDDEDMNDIKKQEWQEWNILLEDFNDVNLTDINNVYIGFGNRDNPTVGGAGVVYFDDIRLYPPKCIPDRGPVADLSGNCIVQFEDFAILGNQWLQPPGSPSADISEPPDGVVNMLDLDVLTESWLEQKLWPVP